MLKTSAVRKLWSAKPTPVIARKNGKPAPGVGYVQESGDVDDGSALLGVLFEARFYRDLDYPAKLLRWKAASFEVVCKEFRGPLKPLGLWHQLQIWCSR
jgi:hypothetical protein